MAQEINLGGTIYISSKRAAEKTGYTQDYIGQLARGGAITAQRVSGLWYVVEESLRDYKSKADDFKPTPPPRPTSDTDLDSSVSFDGRDYVSAQRAAKLTGYNQDYVGQLARTEKILSRQIGNRWFVDREGIVEHKRYNDSLLAAVQAESVGLAKNTPDTKQESGEATELHFNYFEEEVQPTPELTTQEPSEEEVEDSVITEDSSASEEADITTEIPIRVVSRSLVHQEDVESSDVSKRERVSYISAHTVSVITIITVDAALLTLVVLIVSLGFIDVVMLKERFLPDFVLQMISNSIEYTRDTI